uniref:Uncharacterized protein n=1 Tax=Anguilla anguilla TaxID=7936 RepID=A0A0E9X1Q2_ANGAN
MTAQLQDQKADEKLVPDLGQIRICFGFKYYALLILSGVLEPMKCSQKVQTPPGHIGRLSFARKDQ